MMPQGEEHIELLLGQPPFAQAPDDRQRAALPLFRQRIQQAAQRCPPYRRYVDHWPVPIDRAERLAELPYLPVSVFKSGAPLSCLGDRERVRMIVSSATTGQAPSRIVVDAPTARFMARGAAAILKDFVGSERRPLLIVDIPFSGAAGSDLDARAAAVRALMPFASRTDTVLCPGDSLALDLEALRRACQECGNGPVLVYGFTYLIWFHFVEPLRSAGIRLGLANAHVLHSGGWKRLVEAAVPKDEFNCGVADVLGCAAERVIDFYGMVENTGVVYPDCEYGNKHVPVFADVIVRNPRTLAPADPGTAGIIQVGSLLPTSFPGHLLLTEDMGTVEMNDGCPCGRRGLAFRLIGRIPRAELRGCGNVLAHRLGTGQRAA